LWILKFVNLLKLRLVISSTFQNVFGQLELLGGGLREGTALNRDGLPGQLPVVFTELYRLHGHFRWEVAHRSGVPASLRGSL